MSKAAKWSRRWLLGLLAASCFTASSAAQAPSETPPRLQPLESLRPQAAAAEERTDETELVSEQLPPTAPLISSGRMQLRRGRRKVSFAEFVERNAAEPQMLPQLRTGRGTRQVPSSPATGIDSPLIEGDSILFESDEYLEPMVHEPCLDPDGCSECLAMNACVEGCGYFGGAELLLWWRKSRSLPPLVSTDVIGPGAPGVVLFGAETVGGDIRPGGRATIGRWLTPYADWGVMGRFFALGNEQIRFNSSETMAATVGRPLIEVDPDDDLFNQEAILQVDGFPGFNGVATASSESEVYGGDLLVRRAFYQDGCSRGDLLFGYRGARIHEDLTVSHDLVTTTDDLVVSVLGIDSFDVKNEFHGFDLGVLVETQCGNLSFDLLGKVALGDMKQSVSVRGFSRFQTGDVVETFPEALLVKATNAGVYERNKFAVSPELNANARWRLNNCLDLTIGYSFLYWTGVVQPGDLVDRFVNSSQEMGGPLVGEPRPRFRFFDTSYWAHGLSFGVNGRF